MQEKKEHFMPADKKKFFSKKKNIQILVLDQNPCSAVDQNYTETIFAEKPRLDYFADREGREVLQIEIQSDRQIDRYIDGQIFNFVYIYIYIYIYMYILSC